ncbi:hypothetical protein [Pseudocitrobacter vendiensis]
MIPLINLNFPRNKNCGKTYPFSIIRNDCDEHGDIFASIDEP